MRSRCSPAVEDGVRGALIPTIAAHSVTFVGTGDGTSIAWTFSLGTGVVAAARYRDLDVPQGIVGRLDLAAGSIALHLDNDGDGTFETFVTPTISQTSPGIDLEPPTLTYEAANVGGDIEITLTASDSSSAIEAICYSMDGDTFHPYSGPILVAANVTDPLYAFADDAKANRVGLLIPLGGACLPRPVC